MQSSCNPPVEMIMISGNTSVGENLMVFPVSLCVTYTVE